MSRQWPDPPAREGLRRSAGAPGLFRPVVLGLLWRSGPAFEEPDKTALMKQREQQAKGRPLAGAAFRARIRAGSQAVISSEDQNFSDKGATDASRSRWRRTRECRFARGGSTIPSSWPRTLFRDGEEPDPQDPEPIATADRGRPHGRILDLLNVIEWGDGLYGGGGGRRQAASPLDVDASEAAGLALRFPILAESPLVNLARHAWRGASVADGRRLPGRTAAGLGSEPPPPEPVEDEGEPEEAPPRTAAEAPCRARLPAPDLPPAPSPPRASGLARLGESR
jgi:hypothetical protein